MRRGLFVDYLDIAGPFHPSAAPPESYSRIFVCGHPRGAHKAECSTQIVTNLLERAYRRPVTPAEVESKARLIRQAQSQGDNFEEAVEVALSAVLASPNFLFRVEREPRDIAAAGERIRARIATLVFSVGEHAGRSAVPHRAPARTAQARSARSASAPHDGRSEVAQPGRQLRRAVAAASQSGPAPSPTPRASRPPTTNCSTRCAVRPRCSSKP